MTQRILLVEDEATLARALSYNLKHEGYEVDHAATVKKARERVGNGEYDLLILDVMLPDGDGFELCSELRTSGLLTPIIMLTAKGYTEDIVEGLQRGADDYVTKPYTLDVLLSRVAAQLRRRSWQQIPHRRQRFDFGTSWIDFNSRESVARGKNVELTDLEIRLVQFFVENEGRAISRGELLEEVWEVSSSMNTRTVDNFIVRLRKLFEADPSNPQHFLTVRGLGYRFLANTE